MDIIVDLFQSIFSLLTDTKLFNISLLIWLIVPAIIIIVINFIKGKK